MIERLIDKTNLKAWHILVGLAVLPLSWQMPAILAAIRWW